MTWSFKKLQNVIMDEDLKVFVVNKPITKHKVSLWSDFKVPVP